MRSVGLFYSMLFYLNSIQGESKKTVPLTFVDISALRAQLFEWNFTQLNNKIYILPPSFYLPHINGTNYKIGLRLSVCSSVGTLTVAFLDQFSQNLAQT